MDRTISIAPFVAVVAAFGLYHLVGNYAKSRFENSGFESRFPEKTLAYDREEFRRLTASDVRKAYVVPVLFPLDLIVMLALAGSMGAAIWYWFGQLGPLWAMLALVPLIYLVSDLAEDCLLAWMLQRDIKDTYGNQARQRYRIHNPDRGRLPVVAMPYPELAGRIALNVY